jgi:hypothetical protein
MPSGRIFGFMSQICKEDAKRALRAALREFIIKTGSNFYKTLAMR